MKFVDLLRELVIENAFILGRKLQDVYCGLDICRDLIIV
jgi:hypothetical protein